MGTALSCIPVDVIVTNTFTGGHQLLAARYWVKRSTSVSVEALAACALA